MKVMILAAGRGVRMGELTQNCPKPLLPVRGKALIEHHIERLAAAGFRDLVINHAYLGDQIVAKLGDGSKWGVEIQYSAEPEGAYETGGGIREALPLLGEEPFMVLSSDIWTDYPFEQLPTSPEGLAHIVLVPNPEHVPGGDFGLEQGRLTLNPPRWTYSGLGVFRPEFIRLDPRTHFGLGDLLRQHIPNKYLSGEVYEGVWSDIGTPARYAAV